MPLNPLSIEISHLGTIAEPDPSSELTMADRGLDQSIQPMVASNAVGAKEETYLKFRLDAQTAAVIPARSIQEAFILPARQLTAMPNLPAALLGLTNRRNQIIWVVDLAQLLGLSIFDASTRQYNLLLIQVGMLQLGLAVHGIEGMVRLSTDRIQAPIGQMSVSLLPYLQGCTWTSQNDQPEILLVLDAEAITQSPILNSG